MENIQAKAIVNAINRLALIISINGLAIVITLVAR